MRRGFCAGERWVDLLFVAMATALSALSVITAFRLAADGGAILGGVIALSIIGIYGAALRDTVIAQLTIRRQRVVRTDRYTNIYDIPDLRLVPTAVIDIIQSYAACIADTGTYFRGEVGVDRNMPLRALNSRTGMNLALSVSVVIAASKSRNGDACARARFELAHCDRRATIGAGNDRALACRAPSASLTSERVEFRGAAAESLAAAVLQFEAHRDDTGYCTPDDGKWHIDDELTCNLFRRALASASFTTDVHRPADIERSSRPLYPTNDRECSHRAV